MCPDHRGVCRCGVCSRQHDNHIGRREHMIFNARDKITRGLLSLAGPLPLNLYYRHHFPLPSVILIENTNCCNARCVMCPREKLTRKPGFMAFEVFEKIIRDVSGARRKPVVHLHGFGEPLLDEVLPDRIKLAKAFGIKHTYLVTNASLLFPETARKIIGAGLDRMKISFYGTDDESYCRTMRGLDFKVALNNVREFVKIRKEMKKKDAETDPSIPASNDQWCCDKRIQIPVALCSG
ncbi:MAG: radical SAM protein [Desulfobacula sp.]|nr:radical SAM protein [Desulfobacula sp.]